MIFLENQLMTVIDRGQLRERSAERSAAGDRLVQACATTLADTFEVTYSFDGPQGFSSLRVLVPKSDPVLPSITGVYFCAFSYENELQDLFGLRIEGLAPDYKGRFYRKSQTAPFAINVPAPQKPPQGEANHG